MCTTNMQRTGLGAGLLLVAAIFPSTVLAQKTPDVRVDTSMKGTYGSWDCQIAASGDSVYVTWRDDRNGGPVLHTGDIYFNRSLDGGATWLLSDLRLDTDLPGSADSDYPQIAASGDSVYVTWQDDRNGSTDIYFNRSLDGGTTWLPSDLRLETDLPGADESQRPQIATSGGLVCVTWEDLRNSPPPFHDTPDIYFNRSLDGGATWLVTDLKLNWNEIPRTTTIWNPQIDVAGDSVYVVWMTMVQSIYFNCSLDGGTTWLPSDITLSTGWIGPGSLTGPQITASGDSVYVTWPANREGAPGIYFNRSLDRGITWLSSDLRLDTDRPVATGSNDPQIAAFDSSVYVAWREFRNDSSATDIYFNRSLDGGATWLSSDIKVNEDLPGTWISADPQIAASGDSVYVTWWSEEPRTQQNIYFNRSLDGGATWLTSDIRLNRDLWGSNVSAEPKIAASGDSVYVTWPDGREGNSDIYFNIPFGAQPFGEGTQGSAGIAPQLHGTDSLTLGSTFTVTVTDGLGGAFGILALGGPDSKVDQPVLGGPQLINPIDLLAPVFLDGAAGVPGEGTYSIDIKIPVINSLLGFNVNLQVLFLDPSAAYGVAWSNGVEAWIL